VVGLKSGPSKKAKRKGPQRSSKTSVQRVTRAPRAPQLKEGTSKDGMAPVQPSRRRYDDQGEISFNWATLRKGKREEKEKLLPAGPPGEVGTSNKFEKCSKKKRNHYLATKKKKAGRKGGRERRRFI